MIGADAEERRLAERHLARVADGQVEAHRRPSGRRSTASAGRRSLRLRYGGSDRDDGEHHGQRDGLHRRRSYLALLGLAEQALRAEQDHDEEQHQRDALLVGGRHVERRRGSRARRSARRPAARRASG